MSIRFSQGKLTGDECKSIVQAVQKQAQAAAVTAIRAVLGVFLEEAVTAKLGRGKGEPRQVSAQAQVIDWSCGHWGCHDANQFTRDGHYRRSLATGWGDLTDLRVPMLACQQCGHDVVCHDAILEKCERFWLDLDQEVVLGSGLCESLRHLSQRWGAMLGGSGGLRTLNERINQLEPLLQRAHTAPLTASPPVVQCDGIWLTVQTQQETVKVDKRQRRRHQRSGKRVGALGFWPDGKREVLDWEIANSESKAGWKLLLDRLRQRGVQPELGLQAIIRAGSGGLGEAVAGVYGSTVREPCGLFHKLCNVADKSREDLKGKENQARRAQLRAEAAAIYQAETVVQARERFVTWAQTWRQEAPKAVATLEREFEQPLTYYSLDGLAREWIRTTSLLERTNRQLRRKFRQAVTFGSRKGAAVAIYLQVQRLHAQWTGQTWAEVSHELCFALWNLNP